MLAGKGFINEPTALFADGDTVVVLTQTALQGQAPAEQVDILTLRDEKIEFRSVSDTLLQQKGWGAK